MPGLVALTRATIRDVSMSPRPGAHLQLWHQLKAECLFVCFSFHRVLVHQDVVDCAQSELSRDTLIALPWKGWSPVDSNALNLSLVSSCLRCQRCLMPALPPRTTGNAVRRTFTQAYCAQLEDIDTKDLLRQVREGKDMPLPNRCSTLFFIRCTTKYCTMIYSRACNITKAKVQLHHCSSRLGLTTTILQQYGSTVCTFTATVHCSMMAAGSLQQFYSTGRNIIIQNYNSSSVL